MRSPRRREPCFGEDDRFRATRGVGDETFGVQPVERVPIESLPGAALVMQSKQQQDENGRVDAIEIRFVRGIGVLGIVLLPESDPRCAGQPTLCLRRRFPCARGGMDIGDGPFSSPSPLNSGKVGGSGFAPSR